jgi:chromosome partitioning protein
MRTIAFVSQKGGSGKSTIASSLAVAAHEMSEKVCVIDMDPQASLMKWARIRADGDIEVLASGAARLPALLASLGRRGVTLALLDTPGAEGAASTAAMQVADLNIVPSRPSLFDLWASARARTALEQITELNPSGAAAQEMCGLWRSITARLSAAKVGRSTQKAA